ncbi:MAG: bifunctional UDP-N-acetylglucosamine diphosphorylase/glucosamine-1-phosphate N-acetyltransferase GlmU [Chromatiaceae bacterium]|nr:bifunctional UDP-N-acetylglucosamine diphosphorylase/glucosamine-1-phosphate N-acetyltransferase GlmU [Gammaproteobacteria bacterium]MCP5300637.1 bifunctional UDP-N-acetylglucosamine diphosphorylase/glucosamine-1-phosphate N-acetyltransferase GlmU [Chromatiaceae bacterium]MCP5422709.1 bifunctional UDP-N-acetylglucosamine diphosphorylase/glucosamine-1-phosphate N-acetyltransferase GlmU [Chromatiaceae bacterium]
MKLGVVILAAGQGTRMKSDLPKVLHRVAGKPLLGHVIDCARGLSPVEIVVVYGHGGERVRAEFDGQHDLQWVEQAQQLGTGHAVQQAMPALNACDQVLVLYGDVPLTRNETLRELVEATAHQGFGLLTVTLADPTGYGRIVRNDGGRVQRIVEQKDAGAEELTIREVNTGIMCVPRDRLSGWLSGLSNGNAQGEYYLTDVLAMAVADGFDIQVRQPAAAIEAEGVNNRVQLATLERAHQRRVAERLMTDGVTLRDPGRVDVRGTITHGRDCEIDVNALFEGQVTLGDRVRIGANCVLRNVEIGDDVEILDNCVIEQATIGRDSKIGPFSRLRPGAELVGGAHVGNFVEIKKSVIGLGSKVNHLSYIGDTEIGAGVNIGAGTITCNYDGANKHKTTIGDRAFIGSNSALVAPVTIGENATIGAGSVIGKDAPADKLTLTRAKQVSIDWKRPTKKK